MLNMDMVGRGTSDSLQLIGAGEGSALLATTRGENRPSEFILTPTALTGGGSDHMSFAKHGIPVIFYHTGLHEQYHKVTDHADLIDTLKIARVADLVFRTAWRTADTIEPSSK
jgi:Zn-dependent M28 family amino/carboxypeptidase